ncbi:MAG: SusF/SusE family outer membrane protein [Bacteroides sp.]
MKNLNIIALMALGALGIVSCDSDRDSNPLLQEPTTFVLNAPAYASTVYDLKHSKTLELACSQPDYGFTAATDYSVQVSLTGEFNEETDKNTAATYQTLPSVYTTARMNVDAQELAVAIVNLSGITEEENFYKEPIKVYIRMHASVNGGLNSIVSNVIELPQVLSYFALDAMVMPEKMYMTGSPCGWDWAKSFPMVSTYPAASGEFWLMTYLAANDEIKFNMAKTWDGTEFGFANTVINDAANAGVADSGGNIKVTNAGWYIVAVKTTIVGRSYTYAVDFLAPTVYVCGPTVGGKWGADGQKFTTPAAADGEFVSPALTESGELRLCVVLPKHEWWHTEFIFFGGKLEYRANGNDQERVQAEAGKKVYLNFTKGTGRVE